MDGIDRDGSEDGVGSRGGTPPDERLMPDSNPPSSPRSRHPSTKWWDGITSLFNDWWLLELLAVLLSFAAMAAIISLLLQYRDRPLREWPYRITINTLVSFFNSLAKGALLLVTAQVISQWKWIWFHQSKPRALYDMQMLDDASRGPLGALQLILHAPKLTLAALSGLIIFLSFAMDPFAQQILSFPQRSMPGQLATIGRVQDYVRQPVTQYKADGSLDVNVTANLPEGTMLKAIYSGIFGEPTSLNYDCTFKVEAKSGTLSGKAFNPWYFEGEFLPKKSTPERGGGYSNYLTPPAGYDPQGSVLNYTFNPDTLSKYFDSQILREFNAGNDLRSQLSLAENATEMVSNIGQSMTAALMNAGDRKQQGTSFTTEVFIHVHWLWIILPAMLVLSAAATLLLMMFQTWSNKMAIWKTSNLALVFHSAELSDRESSAYNSATEMNNKASSIKTELVSRDMKWQFIRR
ncbi:MAG: hypothetical protein Q9212_006941 [Teloschistes hypoglaucus]